MSAIVKVIGREILDSRGHPTVEAAVFLEGGVVGTASVPSGASTGKHEAFELRDNDQKRYFGMGVKKAVNHISDPISKALKGLPAEDQERIDSTLCTTDGSPLKSNLGANALLAVSLAVARAAAMQQKKKLYQYIASLLGKPDRQQLPVPMMNILNGGKHADNALSLQEFMIIPIGASCFSEAVRWGSEVFFSLKGLLKAQKLSTLVGDEGGFAPTLKNTEEALQLLSRAIEAAGYQLGQDIVLGLDCAASSFYEPQTKQYAVNDQAQAMNAQELTHQLTKWAQTYPIMSIEDGLSEDDWEGFVYQTDRLGDVVQIVGDDLFVTQTSRILKGIQEGVANAVLIKPNQVGTLSETLKAIEMAQSAGYGVIISHRSGETEDPFIADLAVGSAAGQIKAGSLSRSERLAKYNRLMQIEMELGTEKSGYTLSANYLKTLYDKKTFLFKPIV